MTLPRLLTLAGVPRYVHGLWFGGCVLEKTILLVPDAQLLASLDRLYLAQLQQVLPGLRLQLVAPVTAAPKPPGYLNAKGRAWHARQQTDLLD